MCVCVYIYIIYVYVYVYTYPQQCTHTPTHTHTHTHTHTTHTHTHMQLQYTPKLYKIWKEDEADETDQEQAARIGMATSMTKALEQARILAYELLDHWSDLLVGDKCQKRPTMEGKETC